MANPVLNSARWIAEHAVHVRVNDPASVAQEMVPRFKGEDVLSDAWRKPQLNSKGSMEDSLMWVFVVDTLNFCFWNPDGTPVKIANERYGGVASGYWALCAAINNAVDRGIPVLDPGYLSTISEEDMGRIFATSDGKPLPLLKERQEVLREAAQWLVKEFSGSVETMVRHYKTCLALSLGVSEMLSSYKDRVALDESSLDPRRPLPSLAKKCESGDRVLYFHKRAQILAADLHTCLVAYPRADKLALEHPEDLTMFADYRVPQILATLGLLSYDKELCDYLETHEIESGSWLECEIRGCAIVAVERLVEALSALAGRRVTNIECDYTLWLLAKEIQGSADALHANMCVPMHRTRGIFY